jgi:poly(beta-D-mannuronate) lyase
MLAPRLSGLLILSPIVSLLAAAPAYAENPADKIDLKFWKLTLPTDDNDDGKADEISVSGLRSYSHPDWFYVDQHGWVVMTAPNKGTTTATSSNTRSELRQMFRGTDTSVGTHSPKNNFALRAHRRASTFADIGGQLEATLRVLHVATRAKHPERPSAFSVVVGQIHATNDESIAKNGFGYGNEPLKIFYKKWPGHDAGSVFWTYERNLEREDPNRRDIAYTVWGNAWTDPNDPGENGVALGELFNYNVNVHKNTMYLTFRTRNPADTKTFQINLSNNVDAHGNVDEKDNPQGYAGDALYFKAGNYNQCGTKDVESYREPACAGTGDWETDKANGDYASVAFRRITLSRSVDPNKGGS